LNPGTESKTRPVTEIETNDVAWYMPGL